MMSDHKVPKKKVMSGEQENVGKRGPGREEKEWTDCAAEYLVSRGTRVPPH